MSSLYKAVLKTIGALSFLFLLGPLWNAAAAAEEDGYDLLRKVRALSAPEGGATPAVALTGYAREQDHKAALAAGYQEFVAKPVNLEELATAILRASAHNP